MKLKINICQKKTRRQENKKKGKKLLIYYGNLSMNSCFKGNIPSPGIGIKRLLHSRFEILETVEFITRKLYNKTFKELTNVKVRKRKHSNSLYKVLTLKEKLKSA
jgi:hypothetical protein